MVLLWLPIPTNHTTGTLKQQNPIGVWVDGNIRQQRAHPPPEGHVDPTGAKRRRRLQGFGSRSCHSPLSLGARMRNGMTRKKKKKPTGGFLLRGPKPGFIPFLVPCLSHQAQSDSIGPIGDSAAFQWT